MSKGGRDSSPPWASGDPGFFTHTRLCFRGTRNREGEDYSHSHRCSKLLTFKEAGVHNFLSRPQDLVTTEQEGRDNEAKVSGNNVDVLAPTLPHPPPSYLYDAP